MTKEEKIKEAWGSLSDKINENGWLYFGYACNGWCDVENWLECNNLNSNESYYDMIYDECDNGDLICVQVRPKTLQGIENNNGWIKIESEEDLPKEKCDLLVYPEFENQFVFHFYNDKKCKEVLMQNHTHYQPIEKPKPPIY